MSSAAPTDSDRFIYCLNCFYNLFGLKENRCPECGRQFDPLDSRTFSPLPHPDHVPKVIRRVAVAINQTVDQMIPRDPAATRELNLLRRLSSLERINRSLRAQLDMLVTILSENGHLTERQIQAIQVAGAISEAEALEQIVDDEEAASQSNASPELLALSQALKAKKS